LEFDAKAVRAQMEAISATLPEDQTPVLSSEILVGNPFLGGRESDVFAQRLKQVFPEARILITIRAQQKIILSTYAQYVKRGGTMTAAQFFSGAPDMGYYGFDLNHFLYDRLVQFYQSLFGAENVYVCTQESFKGDLQAACQGIAAFAGNARFAQLQSEDTQRVGVSVPEYVLPLQRRVNYVRVSTLDPNPVIALSRKAGQDMLFRAVSKLASLSPVRRAAKNLRPITKEIIPMTSGQYEASNKRLQEIVHNALDLSGYDLA